MQIVQGRRILMHKQAGSPDAAALKRPRCDKSLVKKGEIVI